MRRLLLGACAAALLGPAPAAQAASIGVGGQGLLFLGGPEAETITITIGPDSSRVEDAGAPLEVQAGCVRVDAHTATCTPAPGVIAMVQSLGGNDTVSVTGGLIAHVDGGDGDDTVSTSGATSYAQLDGGAGDDHLLGGDELDQFFGGPGADHLDGGAGDDLFEGESDGDDISGGEGRDSVTYRLSAEVAVSLDDVANDGYPPHPDDDVHGDVEDVDATAASSAHLVGDDADNRLTCGSGCTIEGRGGSDAIGALHWGSLDGGEGNDVLYLYVPYTTGNVDMHGGPGGDTVVEQLSDANSRVLISLDDQANDGEVGFGGADNVHTDIENVIGGDGDDSIRGDDAPNAINGGAGSDYIDPGFGADVVRGGPGRDAVDYGYRTSGVHVTLDGVADDGEAGEGDDVFPDVEIVRGTDYDDQLQAGPQSGDVLFEGLLGADVLAGGAGDDVLHGDLGADTLSGGAGEDLANYSGYIEPVTVSLDGLRNDGTAGENDLVGTDVEDVITGSGNDTITGSAADNFLEGGDGNDTIVGGEGADVLLGVDGDDTIVANDGVADDVDCGEGFDRATVDKVDLFDACEALTVIAQAASPAPPAPPATPVPQPPHAPPTTPITPTPRTAVPSARLSHVTLFRRRTLVATVGCPRTRWGACRGTLTATAVDGHGRPLGHVAFDVPAGKTRTVRLAIVSPARQALAHRRTAHVVLRATVRGGGHSRTVVRRVTFHLG